MEIPNLRIHGFVVVFVILSMKVAVLSNVQWSRVYTPLNFYHFISTTGDESS